MPQATRSRSGLNRKRRRCFLQPRPNQPAGLQLKSQQFQQGSLEQRNRSLSQSHMQCRISIVVDPSNIAVAMALESGIHPPSPVKWSAFTWIGWKVGCFKCFGCFLRFQDSSWPPKTPFGRRRPVVRRSPAISSNNQIVLVFSPLLSRFALRCAPESLEI